MHTVAWWEEAQLRESVLGAERILVAGNAGAGKTTLCKLVHAVTGIEYTELDSLYFGPGWTKLDTFETTARALADSVQWITEWQYPVARELLAERADLLIWLDLPRWMCLVRIVERSIRRRLLGVSLWNGNVEPPLHQMLSNRYHTVRWAFRHHNEIRNLVKLNADQSRFDVIRVGSARELSSLSTRLGALGGGVS